jgi:hypothetical protein
VFYKIITHLKRRLKLRKIKLVAVFSTLAIILGFGVASAQTDYLIWDLDGNNNSGPVIRNALTAKGYSGVYDTTLTPYIGNLSNYCAIWICLGIAFDNDFLSPGSPEVDSLVSYLVNFNGTIYLEGGDTWTIDPVTALHPFFNISGLNNGSADTDSVLGQGGAFTAGMAFNYSGDNNFMDRLGTLSTAFVIFANNNPAYNNGIAYDDGGGSYKTVGTSFEFGGLDDGASPSTKADLADSIMHFFGCTGSVFAWDVAVISIDSPGLLTRPNTPVAPQVNVKNLGTNTASFNVTCEINGYNNTQSVSSLAPDAEQQVAFTNWVPADCGSTYTMRAYSGISSLYAQRIHPQ